MGGEVKGCRRSYQKPQLEKVNLVLEEAVLTFCKAPSIGGTKNKCGAGPCSTAGGS